MKTKIVVWGTDDNQGKVLMGLELIEDQNKVRIYTFKEEVATEVFYNKLMNLWREGQDITFPEHQVIDRELSITEDLLPDHLKTMRGDIINRAKTEWHFVVLSSKLFQTYSEEVEEIKEKVDQISKFDDAIWEEMKGFWGKVQKQIYEKNLFREHAQDLKERTNGLFDQMKEYKKAMNKEFEEASQKISEEFNEKLEAIEERIDKGLGLDPIFNELKNLQRDLKNKSLTRKDRNNIWKRIDKGFKAVKEKKYGPEATKENTPKARLERRYSGLLSAIEKMQKSIARDKKDEEFQQRRIDTTDGQLELQIRQAKLAMVQERISSKEKKLQEMLSTKVDLERRIELENAKIQKKKEQEEVKKAKEAIKENIAEEIQQAEVERAKAAEKLEEAAEMINESKGKAPAATSPKESADTSTQTDDVSAKATTETKEAPATTTSEEPQNNTDNDVPKEKPKTVTVDANGSEEE